MWVARDKVGTLAVFINKPIRIKKNDHGKNYWTTDGFSHGRWMYLFNDMFPNLTWEDEPIEVNLVEVNPKHKMTCPHCYQMIEYTSKDIKTSYDCQPASGFYDAGEDYITCPNCGKTIDL